MNDHHQIYQDLCKQYALQSTFRNELATMCPILWRKVWPASPSCVISIQQGWANLIYEASANIEKILERTRVLLPIQLLPYPSAIIEKFGALRITCKIPHILPQAVLDRIYNTILHAEYLSVNICEFCGREGFLRFLEDTRKLMRPVKILCNEHFKLLN